MGTKRKNKVALVQMCSTSDIQANAQKIKEYSEQAKKENVAIVAFPENCLFLGNPRTLFSEKSGIFSDTISVIQNQARLLGLSILLGSVFEPDRSHPGKFFNTSLLIDQSGSIAARYRKIHLFDIQLPDVYHQESERTSSGNELVVVDHDLGKLGLSICYDIRFPSLYQRLRNNGAEIVFVPSAFTVPTGKAHWLTLLKARAIENQVYIAAPAQIGKHSETRESYGKTVLIDPWGDIVKLADDKEMMIVGEIESDYIKKIRSRMPVQQHKVENIDLI